MPVPTTSVAVPRLLLRDEVYAALLDAIVRGDLAPEERLRDEAIEEWAGASRTPVREAIGRLASIGMVEVLPQRQTRVAPLDVDRFAQSAEVVSALYLHAVRQAIPLLTTVDRIALEAYRDEVLVDGRSAKHGMLQGRTVTSLFAIFVHRYGNTAIGKLCDHLTPHVRRGLNVMKDRFDFAQGIDELRAFIDASLAGETEGAVVAARSYFDEVLPSLVAIMRDSIRPETGAN